MFVGAYAWSTESNQGVIERLADATKLYTAARKLRKKRPQRVQRAAAAAKAAPSQCLEWPEWSRAAAAVQKAKAPCKGSRTADLSNFV